jgi:hypothetical protein
VNSAEANLTPTTRRDSRGSRGITKSNPKTMKYSISIDHELKIVRYRQSELINVEDICEAWNELLTFQEFTVLKYNLLSDFRNGKFQIKIGYLSEAINFLESIETIVRGKEHALIVEEPYSVAISLLFIEKANKQVGFNVQLFTTEVSALKWLGNTKK